MMENGKPRKRRQLSPEEKWEIFLEVTSQELSQADAARKYGVDVSVIIRLRALAKDATLAAFASAKPVPAGVNRAGRVRAVARGERSALRSDQGDGDRADVAPGKAALGLFGPVPARERRSQARAVRADRPGGRRRVGAHARVQPGGYRSRSKAARIASVSVVS